MEQPQQVEFMRRILDKYAKFVYMRLRHPDVCQDELRRPASDRMEIFNQGPLIATHAVTPSVRATRARMLRDMSCDDARRRALEMVKNCAAVDYDSGRLFGVPTLSAETYISLEKEFKNKRDEAIAVAHHYVSSLTRRIEVLMSNRVGEGRPFDPAEPVLDELLRTAAATLHPSITSAKVEEALR